MWSYFLQANVLLGAEEKCLIILKFQKYPWPPHRRGTGFQKLKDFKGTYEGKLEFLEVFFVVWKGEFQLKNFLWGEYGYLLEQHSG